MTNSQLSISIVTPSFNQADFLEKTILSVLDQDYPNLDYVIIDGDSTDTSKDIIRRYEDRLAWWTSEPDKGQYDAINKGFANSNGEIMGWLNADDLHLTWTLALVAEIFTRLPEVEWLTTLAPLVCNEDGLPVRCRPRAPFSRRGFFNGDNLPGMGWHASGWIQQEATFWRRSLWQHAGGRLDASLKLAGDFDLWARFFSHAELYAVEVPMAAFRRHPGQRTAVMDKEYKAEALSALRRHGGGSPSKTTAAAGLALRRLLPNRIKPLASRLGVLASGKICAYDPVSREWRIDHR
jgi:glycosyltransferase involved in cell wall biosynthesis